MGTSGRRHPGGMAVGASAELTCPLPPTGSSMQNQSQSLSWSLSGLLVAEVSRWVTKFSSFCKAKQHFTPSRLLPPIPRGNLKGRCN